MSVPSQRLLSPTSNNLEVNSTGSSRELRDAETFCSLIFHDGLFYIIQKSPFGHLLKGKVISLLARIPSSQAVRVNDAIITQVVATPRLGTLLFQTQMLQKPFASFDGDVPGFMQ